MNHKRTRYIWESLFIDGEGNAFSVREEPDLTQHKTPASELQRSERIKAVRAFIAILPKRSREIIGRRYGLHDQPETLARIGRRYGISKQRISQLEAAAIKDLRIAMENRGTKDET